MATRRRIPMVEDHPVRVPLEVAEATGVVGPLEVSLRPREELSSEEDAKEFDWGPYADLMIACLIIPKTVEYLVDYWKANQNMLDWAKKVAPDQYERIRLAFADRKAKLKG